MTIRCIVLAHNEERRIATCLGSLPLGAPGIEVIVIVNGSGDATARIARGFAYVEVREYKEGGKSRSWNRYVLDEDDGSAEYYVFVDGDAQILPGSLQALANCLDANRRANAASGFPCNGRNHAYYREALCKERGIFGDLYALSGDFVRRLHSSGLRLPDDLIGDDGFICALAKTDLAAEDNWDDHRVVPCEDAGFLCEPTTLSPQSLRGQYRRMINYSVRHFQNQIITDFMRRDGPASLPAALHETYPDYLPHMAARNHPQYWWFDRQALARMRRATHNS